jgi:hypothetical protein
MAMKRTMKVTVVRIRASFCAAIMADVSTVVPEPVALVGTGVGFIATETLVGDAMGHAGR